MTVICPLTVIDAKFIFSICLLYCILFRYIYCYRKIHLKEFVYVIWKERMKH